jgi:hypothetical protein
MNGPTRRERFVDALGKWGHLYVFIGTVGLIVAYAAGKDFASLPTAFISDVVKVLLASVGLIGGVLALFVMLLLPKGDPKLAQFQFYMIIGSGISTLAGLIGILTMLGIMRFQP